MLSGALNACSVLVEIAVQHTAQQPLGEASPSVALCLAQML